MNILDVHTHDVASSHSIINLDIASPRIEDGKWYSVGVHPWDTADTRHPIQSFDVVKELAVHPQVLAIGETGLDRLKGADMETQMKLLKLHISLAESVGKPLILHIVKAYPEIISMKKQYGDSVAWIVHGYRGKPQEARELLRHGFYISLGDKYNETTAAVIPSSRLLVETDTAEVDIDALAARHSQLDSELPDKLFKVG